MNTIIYFDICAVILLVILLFSAFSRKMIQGTTSRCFVILLISTLACGIFDIWAVVLNEQSGFSFLGPAAKYIANSGYFVLHVVTTSFYIIYFISLTDTWHLQINKRWLKLLLIVTYSFLLIALAVNPVTHSVFYFNEQQQYTRGTLFPILYACAFLYMVIGFFYLMRYRKLFTADKFFALMTIFPLNIAAVVIQWFFPVYLVEIFANTLGLLFITMTIQRPEETIHPATKLRNYNAYATDMKRSFTNGKKIRVLMIKIGNYNSLLSLLGYDSTNKLLKKITGWITSSDREHKAYADMYYLNMGLFCIVINERRGHKITSIAEQLNTKLRNNIRFHQLELNLLAYMCIAACPEDIDSFQALITFSDSFHKILPSPGNIFYASDMAQQNPFGLTGELDSIIDAALANRKFEVYYQPIYSVEKKRFISAEALLRLKDDKYGFISPELFISAAEKSGAIHKIGNYVLEEVCRFISSSKFDALGLDYIEINLSVAQCMQADLADNILETLRKYTVSSDKINLEITETAVSYSQSIMTENLLRLSQSGISFSLDDYGTGYSNIKRVASLPLKMVKLDKSFVDEIDNPRMMIVLKNTIAMLKSMNLEIVVEGIETEHVAKQFADFDCEYIQGYYYSRPVPEEDFIRIVQQAAPVTGLGAISPSPDSHEP